MGYESKTTWGEPAHPRGGISARDLAYGGLFGAAALLLPTIFHLLHLGRVFMPMYLPLVALAFLVRPGVAVTTALLVPLISAFATGMPPLYPPIAPVMALELGAMALCISLCYRWWPRANEWVVLIPVLLLGRVLGVLLNYGAALVMELPAGFVAGLSLLSGWPGVILMVVAVPPLVRTLRDRSGAYAFNR
jgi:hypothetical protein